MRYTNKKQETHIIMNLTHFGSDLMTMKLISSWSLFSDLDHIK